MVGTAFFDKYPLSLELSLAKSSLQILCDGKRFLMQHASNHNCFNISPLGNLL